MSLPPAAILAGGMGTRIRALAGTTPKVLLPVEGRPFLAHVLEYLAADGVTEAVLCLGHAADVVADAAVTCTPAEMTLLVSRETEPLGTGGALRLALPELGPRFLIVNADTYLPAPLGPLMQRHTERDAALTLSLVRSEHAAEKGTVRVSPEGNVLAFSEKIEEGTGLINGGVYLAESSVFADLPVGKAISLEREVIPGLLAVGAPVAALTVEVPFVDIGLPEDYLRVRDRLPRVGEER